ncbi:carboxymuconolactone decarboxylase family protein [Mycobacterium parascrofulaceum ATCC BAA-614]|uniref:Carboxymuconolactone decarboxylase family protein n=1 Tax=Mycobacterium parascrofulaceum ATCC BAA-614 TaxID=525368 RepID=D5P615_9MYCO|nr:carboxymuconolactone decarboxylase family protein [Mycobacterium parascrofulaceum]EFG78501.1 carboxymuconolactone decarboxylase family protein [Mycobacterium parascrofulaceum ATCC BAA-614]
MSTTEFPYPDLDTLTPALREAVESRASLNIFRMITHSPNLAPSFLAMAADVLQHNSLPAPWRELVILRVGYRYRARYETYQHVQIGRAIGLGDNEIHAAESGSTDGLDAAQAALIRLTDRLLDNHTLSDAERDQALAIMTVNQLADFTLTVGFYQLVCDFLNTFGVTPEDQSPGR